MLKNIEIKFMEGVIERRIENIFGMNSSIKSIN